MVDYLSINGAVMVPLKNSKAKSQQLIDKRPVQAVVCQEKSINIYRQKMCLYGTDCKYIKSIKPSTGYFCDYAHTEAELNTVSRTEKKKIEKTKICRFGSKCNKKECTFAHTPEELVVKVCNWGRNCKNDYCTYFHGTTIDKPIIFSQMKQEEKIKQLEKETSESEHENETSGSERESESESKNGSETESSENDDEIFEQEAEKFIEETERLETSGSEMDREFPKLQKGDKWADFIHEDLC
jgi:hypothetical protein